MSHAVAICRLLSIWTGVRTPASGEGVNSMIRRAMRLCLWGLAALLVALGVYVLAPLLKSRDQNEWINVLAFTAFALPRRTRSFVSATTFAGQAGECGDYLSQPALFREDACRRQGHILRYRRAPCGRVPIPECKGSQNHAVGIAAADICLRAMRVSGPYQNAT